MWAKGFLAKKKLIAKKKEKVLPPINIKGNV
jgi:hypothetical protein